MYEIAAVEQQSYKSCVVDRYDGLTAGANSRINCW